MRRDADKIPGWRAFVSRARLDATAPAVALAVDPGATATLHRRFFFIKVSSRLALSPSRREIERKKMKKDKEREREAW